MYNDIPPVFMPILWFEQRVTLPKELASEIILAISIPRTGYICAVIVIIIGATMLFWLPISNLLSKKRNKLQPSRDISVRIINLSEKPGKEKQEKPEDFPLIKNSN